MFKLKRRYKLLIIIFVSITSIFIIYKLLNHKKEYIVSIGDYLSTGKILYSNNKNYNKYLKENNNKLFLKEYCKDDLTTYNVCHPHGISTGQFHLPE